MRLPNIIYNYSINQIYFLFKRIIDQRLRIDLGNTLIDLLSETDDYKCYVYGGFIRNAFDNKGYGDIDFRLITKASIDHTSRNLEKILHNCGKKLFNIEINSQNNQKCLVHKYIFGKNLYSKTCDFTLMSNFFDLPTDFTVNSIFYDLKTKRLFDPFYGIWDIKNRSLRTCQDPYKSFKQEGGRLIFRLINTSAKIGYKINKNSFKAITENRTIIDKYLKKMKYSDNDYDRLYASKIFDSLEKTPKTFINLLIVSGVMENILSFLGMRLKISKKNKLKLFQNPFYVDAEDPNNKNVFIISLMKYFSVSLDNAFVKNIISVSLGIKED